MIGDPFLDEAPPRPSGTCCDHGYRELPDGSVAPCKTHLPNVYARWLGRHLDGDHDPEGCHGCRDARKGRRQRPAS